MSYRQLLEALGVAVYTTDAAGLITDYNEAAVALWGRRPQIGKDEWCGSWRLYWPDGSPMAHDECPMAVTLKENRRVRGAEAIAERPDGSRVCFIPYPTPLREPSGALIGAVNVLVDITDRKAAEQALRDNEERLTQALAIKDEFLGLVSHELKTPVTVILGNSRVLARGTEMDAVDRQAALEDMARESERLHAVIDNLLVLARADAGERLDYEPLRVTRIVNDCVNEFRREYPTRDFEVRADETALVNADKTHLRQVMTNLLSNAIKYSPPATRIDVEITRDASAVRISVLDRGNGLGAGEHEKIFESFYRSPTTARSASGVGVGLAVCKRLVEAMHGEVWSRNRDGGGAEVGFTLPAMDYDVTG